MIRIHRYDPVVRFPFGDERTAELQPAKRLSEVQAELLFGRTPEPPHLKKVDAVRYGEEQFLGLVEECKERFAYIWGLYLHITKKKQYEI